MADLSDREHTELMMLWKNAAEDIERAKREQWSHFYAVLLGQAGVAGFSQFEFSPPWHLQPGEVICSAIGDSPRTRRPRAGFASSTALATEAINQDSL